MERSLISGMNFNNELVVNDFAFNSFITDLSFIRDDINMLQALLSYKDFNMINLNKVRAVSAINLAIDSLETLRKSIEEVKI